MYSSNVELFCADYFFNSSLHPEYIQVPVDVLVRLFDRVLLSKDVGNKS